LEHLGLRSKRLLLALLGRFLPKLRPLFFSGLFSVGYFFVPDQERRRQLLAPDYDGSITKLPGGGDLWMILWTGVEEPAAQRCPEALVGAACNGNKLLFNNGLSHYLRGLQTTPA